jgi:hypothetical protein
MIDDLTEKKQMGKNLIFLFLLGAHLFWPGADCTSAASDAQKTKAIPIISNRVGQSFSPFALSGDRFCVIQYDQDSLTWYYPDTSAGNGIALYMDPQICGETPYPFKITGVQFYLHHYSSNGFTAVWPVEIRVNIRPVKEDTLCLGQPGNLPLYHQTFTIPIDSSYDSLGRPMNLGLDSLTNPCSTCCVPDSFFLEIIFTGGTDSPFPSLVMSDSILDFPDSCEAWFLYDGDYCEWSQFWGPFSPGASIPGCPIMRAIGYTNSVDCDTCWYWKPTASTAPSGIPDFDQYQFGDSSAFDVPAAVANCLWWFNAVPEDTNSPDLIRLLSTYLGTDPDSGTSVDSIQSGLDSCFSDYALSLRQRTVYRPTFSEIADSLETSQNIILILGFWQSYENSWHRFGGHAVTLAGICSGSESLWVGLSDPAVDGAELAWQGRFFPLGHPPHPDDDTLHNSTLYVSHDIYASDTMFVVDYGDSLDTLWRIKDLYADTTYLFTRFQGQNFHPTQMQYFHPYEPSEPVHAAVEYAIMICPKSTAVGEEEEAALVPENFELHQNFPNPFNAETVIKFNLRKPADVTLAIYNVLGQKVKTFLKGRIDAGPQSIRWDGTDEKGNPLSSGIYFCQLKVGKAKQTKCLVLLK